MTTARSSSRSSRIGAASVVLALAGAAASAHRTDELLQAARLDIEPGRVEIQIDLTPGTAVAEDVVGEIDLDRNRSIDGDEARAYAVRVMRAMTLDVDGRPLQIDLVGRQVPSLQALMSGEGAMRLDATAVLPRLDDGLHHVRFRNAHRPDVSVYLANALVPEDDRVSIVSQRRDPSQRDLTIDYTLGAGAGTRQRAALGSAAIVLLFGLVLTWRYRTCLNRPLDRRAG